MDSSGAIIDFLAVLSEHKTNIKKCLLLGCKNGTTTLLKSNVWKRVQETSSSSSKTKIKNEKTHYTEGKQSKENNFQCKNHSFQNTGFLIAEKVKCVSENTVIKARIFILIGRRAYTTRPHNLKYCSKISLFKS